MNDSIECGHPSQLKAWVEAIRLRTIPASVAGVIAGCGCAACYGSFEWPQALICLLFAVMAQVASNFANEYFDFKKGLDRKGREGFRRGVTEGDITPSAMRNATFIVLAVAALLGCSLIYWGGWWLLPVGGLIVIFALAYSAGPYPLSHHGLGELTVFVFFGIVPVCLTCYLQTGLGESLLFALPIGAAIGLLASNILVVNNYRDAEDDAAVGKRTTAVLFGRKVMSVCYLVCGLLAPVICFVVLEVIRKPLLTPFAGVFMAMALLLYFRLKKESGVQLNQLLKRTAQLLLAESIWIAISLSV